MECEFTVEQKKGAIWADYCRSSQQTAVDSGREWWELPRYSDQEVVEVEGLSVSQSGGFMRLTGPCGPAYKQDPEDAMEQAAILAATELNKCYKALSEESIFSPQILQESSRKFASQYVALHDFADAEGVDRWRLKPKLHMFLHLCSEK